MRLDITRAESFAAGEFTLHDLVIAGERWQLRVVNQPHPASPRPGEETLCLCFVRPRRADPGPDPGCEYHITIGPQGVRFWRILYRPRHDHNDSEELHALTPAALTRLAESGSSDPNLRLDAAQLRQNLGDPPAILEWRRRQYGLANDASPWEPAPIAFGPRTSAF